MPQPAQGKDDSGKNPEVETFQVSKWLAESNEQKVPPGEFAEQPFRPALRPPVPVLTVLDDGSMDEGEQIRIRSERFRIGRSEGDLILKHDPTLSSRHAEIQRVENRGQIRWLLNNTESVNGTFVRVNGAKLFDDSIVIIGSRRFRLEQPFAATAQPPGDGTQQLDKAPPPDQVWPMLVESSGKSDSLKFPIRVPSVTIGRTGAGCDIELDDPLVAARHATLQKGSDGVWKIAPVKTRNGVWVSLQAIPLTACCFFQCGEQRFKFVLP
jgi:pSer/pThr/pTyr-binding forkhead associated (FHA) protein